MNVTSLVLRYCIQRKSKISRVHNIGLQKPSRKSSIVQLYQRMTMSSYSTEGSPNLTLLDVTRVLKVNTSSGYPSSRVYSTATSIAGRRSLENLKIRREFDYIRRLYRILLACANAAKKLLFGWKDEAEPISQCKPHIG